MDHRHEDRVADEATGRRGGGLGRGREVLFGTLLLTALSVIGLAATAAPPVQAQGDYSQVTRETVRVPMRDGV